VTGGAPSVQQADGAHATRDNHLGAVEAVPGPSALDASAAEDQFQLTQIKTHKMHAVLARAVEAGEFDGVDTKRSFANEKNLLSVLAVLENAKEQLDRVRQRA